MFLETKLLVLWQYNFLFFHIHIAQATHLSNSEGKMLNLYIFFSVSIYKRMNLFALLSTDLFWNALDIKCGKSNYCSLCTVSFLHQQPLTSSSSCSPPDIIPCTVLLVYDSLSESHFHYHHYSKAVNLHYLHNYFHYPHLTCLTPPHSYQLPYLGSVSEVTTFCAFILWLCNCHAVENSNVADCHFPLQVDKIPAYDEGCNTGNIERY